MLKNKWVDKNRKIAFSGVSKIYQHYGGTIPINKIKDELSHIRTYTRHKETKRIKDYNPFFVYDIDEMWQIDLMYLPDLAKFNNGMKYLVCVLDTFSRKMNIVTIKKKNSNTVTEAFDDIHEKFHNTPNKILADNGGEFKCQEFINYCHSFGINIIFTSNETKAAHVERAQRSFQNILYRMMEEKQTKTYLDLLPSVLNIYNGRVNRITGYSPNNAYKQKNKKKVLENLEKYYKASVQKKRKPVLKVGDTVRIKLKRDTFHRGYNPYFSEEVFKVLEVKTNLPQPRYKLTDFNGGEVIGGTFYERELTKAEHQDFKVEKILKERKIGKKKEYFVKWLGFTDQHNSWIDSKWLAKKY
jgi:hypothetical protein